MLVLGIETSCDECSAAVVENAEIIRSNVILTQLVHEKYGGVIPELSSREHIKTITAVVEEALQKANCTFDDIDIIAATHGPGLVGPLLVGLTFAKGLSFALRKPFVPVNHMEGHICANYLAHPHLPKKHLALIVSGGHTMLVDVRGVADYGLIAQTRDDAAGEAFDKISKLMGLGYPGGAVIDRLAKNGNPEFAHFPRAVRGEDDSFSFSGLKTSVALYLEKQSHEFIAQHQADIAASFQEAVVDALVDKTVSAVKKLGVQHVGLTGGVAANSRLRTRLTDALKPYNAKLYYPPLSLCTDNAAMIAAAGYYRFETFGPGELVANAIPSLSLFD